MQDDNHAWTEDDLEFRRVFRNIPLDEIKEARASAERYAEIVWQIYDRIRNDPVEYEKLKKRLEEIRKEEDSL